MKLWRNIIRYVVFEKLSLKATVTCGFSLVFGALFDGADNKNDFKMD